MLFAEVGDPFWLLSPLGAQGMSDKGRGVGPAVSLEQDARMVPGHQGHLQQHIQAWWEKHCLLVSVTEWGSLTQELHPSVAPPPPQWAPDRTSGRGQGCFCHLKAPWREHSLRFVQHINSLIQELVHLYHGASSSAYVYKCPKDKQVFSYSNAISFSNQLQQVIIF